jgi:hypothetical protein
MLNLLRTVGLALAVANLKRRVRNLAVRGVFAVAGAVVLIVSVCFFLVALHLWISDLLNPIASAAILGGVLLLLALLLFFLASRPMREQARAVENPLGQFEETIRDGASRLSDALGPPGSPLRSPVLQAAALALVAGVLLGLRGRKIRRD